MSVYRLDNKPFLKRVILALSDLNTLDFETVESAFTRLVRDLAHNLSEIVDVYQGHKFETSASIVVNLEDRILEKNHKNFLNDLVRYVDEIESEFTSEPSPA